MQLLHRMTHSGTALVVTCELHVGRVMSGGWTNHNGWDSTPFDLILDVTPDGAPPFRTEVRKNFHSMHHPMPGNTLKVKCNPGKQTAVIDISDDARFNRKLYHAADQQRRQAEHDRLLNSPPGTVPHLSFQTPSIDLAPGATRAWVISEMDRSQHWDTPMGIRAAQKLRAAWDAGQIQVEGADERTLMETYVKQMERWREEATAEVDANAG